MTDEEIIKALERCLQHRECCYCNSLEECGSKRILITSVLNLINRQKAEIESLNIELQSMRSAANSYKMHYETAKSEAIKEFAKRLIEKCYEGFRETDEMLSPYVTDDDIDDLVKEMTE